MEWFTLEWLMENLEWAVGLLVIGCIILFFFPILLGFVVFIPSVYSFYLSMIGIFFIGASQASFMSVTTTMVQKIVPDGIRGRIMSLYLLHAGGIMAFGNLILGSLADYIDYSTLFIFTGIAFLVYFLFMFITQKKFRTDIISII